MISRLLTIAVIALVLFLNVQSVLAQAPGNADLMSTANQIYRTGDHGQAAQAFQQLVDQGINNSALFYNLGNAYFRTGDVGRSILNYLRAERLAPRDSDISENLRVARNMIEDDIPTPDDTGSIRDFVGANTWMTVNELALIAIVLWFLTVGLVILFLVTDRKRWRPWGNYFIVGAGALLAVSSISLVTRMTSEGFDENMAVIVAESVDIVSGPGAQFPADFTLHSGTEGRLVESRGNWTKFVFSDGELDGWVPANAIESVSLDVSN